MKILPVFAAAVIAAGSVIAQTVDFPPPTYNRVIIPVAAAPSAPAYLIPNPIGVNERGEVLFWSRQTSGKPMPANREWYTVYKWLPGAATSSLVTTFGDETGRYPTWMPRHGFNNAGQFAVMRQYYAPQIGLRSALGTWNGGGWNDFWAPTIGPTYPGYPHTAYDVNSAGDVVFASFSSAYPDFLQIIAGGIIEKYAGRGGGAIYQASSGMVRFFFPGTTNTCLPLRINNAGMAVGIVTGNSSDFQYKWRGFTGTFAGGATEFAFPGPRGGVTQPTGINGSGEIVGLSGNFPLGWAPFIYLPAPKYGLTAGLHEIAPATPSTAEPSHLDENNRFLSHEALINDSGQVIFNYHNFAHGTPGFWQLGHPWTLTSMVGNFVTNESITFAQDINNRGEILAVMHPTRQTILLRPSLAARLTLQTETCPGGAFTLRLTVTNQSGQPLTQLAAPLLEWNGTGSFAILDPATVSGPSPLPDGQTADITWRVQVSGGLPDGFFVSQGTARDSTNAVINSFLAQSPSIGDFFRTGVTALPNRVGLGNDIQVRVTAFNGTTKTLLNVHPDGVPSPSATGRVQFKSGPVPAGSVTLNPGASFTFTNIFTATNSGTVEFSANVVGTCDGSPITAASGTSGTVRIADRGDLLIKRADESASLYGINDEYQLNPAGAQVRTNTVGLGKVSEFNIQVQNDETNSHSYSLKADESGNLGWNVKYLLNTVDISAAVRAASGTSLPELAGGASHTLTVQMTATNAVAGDQKRSLLVLGDPLEPGEILDAVEAATDLAAEIIVNSTGDEPDADLTDGVPDVNTNAPGLQTTLRCAIDFANRKAGKDIIKFNIATGDGNYFEQGVPTFRPSANLPNITNSVIIDGWSQNPDSQTPPVQIDCRMFVSDPNNNADGLRIHTDSCEIRGFVINGFTDEGIEIFGGANLIQGNFIGTDPTGMSLRPSGNFLTPGMAATFSSSGIFVEGYDNLIGGTEPRQRNVIAVVPAGSQSEFPYAASDICEEIVEPHRPIGIRLFAQGNNRVEGNFIGVNAAGTEPLPADLHSANRQDIGIKVSNASSRNHIGGTSPGSGNVVAGNNVGITIERDPSPLFSGTSLNVVQGNWIGTDRTGTRRLLEVYQPDNSPFSMILGTGIEIHGADHSLIGGTEPGAGNVITSSGAFGGGGIRIVGANAVGNHVVGNVIGVQADGTTPLNIPSHLYFGISTECGVETLIEQNSIGYATDWGIFHGPLQFPNVGSSLGVIQSNRIVSCGVGVGVGGEGIHITRNAVSGSSASGIDLSSLNPDGSLRDLGYLILAVNRNQVSPSIFNVTSTGGTTQIQLDISTHPLTRYAIEFFGSDSPNPTGYGDGQNYLATVEVDTSILGSYFGVVPIPVALAAGKWLTATATDPDGNTSEFSRAVLVQGSTHTESDGMSDPVENLAPSRLPGGLTGDGNGDGIPDAQQANVTSLPTVAGGKWLTLTGPAGINLSNVQSTVSPSPPTAPTGFAFPLGFVSFTLNGLTPGATVAVTNILHESVTVSNVFAFGPTPGNPQPHWYELNFTRSGDELRLSFTDGAVGDHDLSANGSITMLYAPAYQLPPVPQLTLLSHKAEIVDLLSITESNSVPILTTNSGTRVTTVLAWPATGTNYILETTAGLSPTNRWRIVINEPVLIGNQLVLTNGSVDPMRFYRLRPFNFPAVAPAAPTLNIQRTSTNTLLLSWSSSFAGFALQQNTNLVTGAWTSVTNSVNMTNSQNQVLVPPAAGSRYFRLISQ